MDFYEAFGLLIDHEGGYTNNYKDRGNWTSGVVGRGVLKGTKYGISAMSYPDHDIKNLTLQQAANIYKRDYWNACKCNSLPKEIRFKVFDIAVNSGVRTSIKLLQKAVGVKQDGIIGPKTLTAIYKTDPHVIDKRMSGYRLLMISKLKSFKSFGVGWVRRIASNLIK